MSIFTLAPFFAAIFLLAILLVAPFAVKEIHNQKSEHERSRCEAKAPATVIGYVKKRKGGNVLFFPVLAFVTGNGMVAVAQNGMSQVLKGKVTAYYDPDEPSYVLAYDGGTLL